MSQIGPPYAIATIIVSYNSIEFIEKSVLSALTYKDANDVVVVVDNASTDGSRELLLRLRKENPSLVVILLDANIGFGRANNAGMAHVNAEWYFLLNADAWLIADSAGFAIKSCAEDSSIGIIGLPLIFPDGQPQTYAYSFANWRKWLLQMLGAKAVLKYLIASPRIRRAIGRLPMARTYVSSQGRPPFDFDCSLKGTGKITDVDWVCGAAMILRSSFAGASGGFDPVFFLYAEDQDLCATAHRYGWRVVTVEASPVVHVFGWGKNKFNLKIAKLRYESLRYYIEKNIQLAPARLAMKLTLPFYLGGWRNFFRLLA